MHRDVRRPWGLLAAGLIVLGAAVLTRAGAGAAEPSPAQPRTATRVGAQPAPALAWAPGAQQPTSAATTVVDYERQIRPLLQENCLECHSQDKRKGGLSLAAYADVLDGGRSGAAVRPGSASTSLMLARVKGQVGDQMPLDELPLTEAQVALLQRWIDQGARLTPSSPPAPQPWEAPLALEAPPVPAAIWKAWSRPVDRLVASYLSTARVSEPTLVADGTFARRAYLDIWGLLPSPEDLQTFAADASPDKRDRLVARLLADDQKYAEHWMSFWNDLLRNEDGASYFSDAEGGARRSITDWLMPALTSNLPYDQFVRKLLSPSAAGDPEGFLIGVNWRGETSAAVKPWMQASQNSAQAFLGVNFKCNACHDSFVSKWTLKDAYGLAAFFSPEGQLQLFRCDVARDEFTGPSFFYPELNRTPSSTTLADRRATVAAIFTDPRNGRLPRTIVNRLWTRLLGRGIVGNSDEMDGQPWSPAVLDWVASDFVANGYDLKRLIATIVTSRAYQMPAVARRAEMPARHYAFRGPEVRRLTAEQFADAIGSITGEWSLLPGRGGGGGGAAGVLRTTSDPVSAGTYAREFRAASTHLSRALGRPIRDQVHSVRPVEATTLQALELVNGEILTRRLMRGARRLIGELPAEPPSRFNGSIGGRAITVRGFDLDISQSSRLWLLVTDTGSNAPDRVLPMWSQAELVGPDGVVIPLSSLAPIDASGLRAASQSGPARVAVKNPSRLIYDISGRGFTRFRGRLDVENDRADIGSTLNPALRFFIFDVEPNMNSLVPPLAALPMTAPAPVTTVRDLVDRMYRAALGRTPSAAERRTAEAAIADPRRPGRPSADGVADLLWAILMKPEFQLVY